ncbi:hypothetical protein [Flavobacterium sp.]|uniref:hypothetical protein n=1 Tax=Flavobacterium sp. TaxID=239 RepID=UPI0037512BE7
MKKIGSFMAVIGILAVVMNYLGRVPTLLMWIYNWGDTVAWAIKIGLIVVGGALYFFAPKEIEEVHETAPTESNEK